MNRDDVWVMLLLSGLLLHPLMVWHKRDWAAMLLFVAVFVQVVMMACRRSKERFKQDKMDFFPWNEARIVRKRARDSTVIDCGWSLDRKDDNIFHMDDPVVRGWSNLAS